MFLKDSLDIILYSFKINLSTILIPSLTVDDHTKSENTCTLLTDGLGIE